MEMALSVSLIITRGCLGVVIKLFTLVEWSAMLADRLASSLLRRRHGMRLNQEHTSVVFLGTVKSYELF